MSTTTSHGWPKAVDQRIQQVMRLRAVPAHARALVAVEFAAQQVTREGHTDEPVLETVDELLERVFPTPLVCDLCGADDDALTKTAAGTLWCPDCADDAAYDMAGDER